MEGFLCLLYSIEWNEHGKSSMTLITTAVYIHRPLQGRSKIGGVNGPTLLFLRNSREGGGFL